MPINSIKSETDLFNKFTEDKISSFGKTKPLGVMFGRLIILCLYFLKNCSTGISASKNSFL